MVFDYKKQRDGNWGREEKSIALFHKFGIDFEELANGIGNFTTAVVEFPDGHVENIPVKLIRFLKRRGGKYE